MRSITTEIIHRFVRQWLELRKGSIIMTKHSVTVHGLSRNQLEI